ncbi:MAG: hypothetical protein PHS92_00310 [Candidatus Gracilibacteria bacterium]|nr:hypothetical protein [Candidatus Gracilibacteria bacterium]
MFKLIEFFKKRPSDKTIRYGRIVFGLMIIGLLALSIKFPNDYALNIPNSLKSNEIYVRYALMILGFLPILVGITNSCVARRKYMKLIQIILGIALIFVGNNITLIRTQQAPQIKTASGSANFENLTKNQQQKTPVDIGFWIALLGILPIAAGITGKFTTSKCLKYGEVITKIRV